MKLGNHFQLASDSVGQVQVADDSVRVGAC